MTRLREVRERMEKAERRVMCELEKMEKDIKKKKKKKEAGGGVEAM